MPTIAAGKTAGTRAVTNYGEAASYPS